MHPCEEINLPQTIGDVFPKSGIGYKSGKKNCDLIIHRSGEKVQMTLLRIA